MSDVIELYVDRTQTPIGDLMIVADAAGRLRATDWTMPMRSGRRSPPDPADSAAGESRLSRQLTIHYRTKVSLVSVKNPGGVTDALTAYFAGELDAIDTLRVETAGTAFQRTVWSALREIPCGKTISYAALAQRIGRPSAVRAVGLANGANPISIVVPCHRVIGADGSLTGYGGGIERKRWLLAHEGSLPALFA